MNTRITTIVMDMAGTTVVDDGLVESAFALAWDREQPSATADRRESAIQWVRDTMGQSKIEVFRRLLDEDAAQSLNRAFEAAFDELVAAGKVREVTGAEATIRLLCDQGRSVVLSTGFSRATAEGILAALGWHDLVEHVVTPADAGRGRPAPDLNLLAALRTQAPAVAAIAVVGDTESDAASGVAAGAGLVVGVLTGSRAEADLRAAGADEVLASVADLPTLLERLGR